MADTYHEIICGDCLEVMKWLPDKSVDMVLCDLPYGTTQNKWDSVIPFDRLWEQYRRTIKDSTAILLTCQGLFTANLIITGRDLYRYSLVWEKTKAGGFLNAKRMPLQAHEDILIFYKSLPTYNPQMEIGKPYTKKAVTDGDGRNYGKFSRAGTVAVNNGERYPRSVIKMANDNHGSLHPTQKPIALWEYLIRTYTNPGDTVLDNCCGSGTTGVACYNTGRNSIQIDISQEYCDIARKRLAEVQQLQQPTVNKGE